MHLQDCFATPAQLATKYRGHPQFGELIDRSIAFQHEYLKSLYLRQSLDNSKSLHSVRIDNYPIERLRTKSRNFLFTMDYYGSITPKWIGDPKERRMQLVPIEIFCIDGLSVLCEIRYTSVGEPTRGSYPGSRIVKAMHDLGMHHIINPAIELLGKEFGYVLVVPKEAYKNIMNDEYMGGDIVDTRNKFLEMGGRLVPLFPGKLKMTHIVNDVLAILRPGADIKRWDRGRKRKARQRTAE